MLRLLTFSLALCLACGCVSRSLSITTQEPAEIYIDGKHVGRTPYETDFVFYGTHEIMVQDDSGQIAVRDIRLGRPWYQYFPLDFFSELIYPGKIVNHFIFDIALATEEVIDLDAIEQRAEEFRAAFNRPPDED